MSSNFAAANVPSKEGWTSFIGMEAPVGSLGFWHLYRTGDEAIVGEDDLMLRTLEAFPCAQKAITNAYHIT